MSAVLKPATPRLVPMQAADLPRVIPIENAIYEFPWTQGNFDDSLAAGYSCWLFVDGGELVGYCVIMLVLDEAHLLNLSIARAWQGQGHGRALLEAVQDAVRGHGATSVLLEVRPSNFAARRLYSKAGFTQVGLRRNYYPARNGREDALVLKHTL